MARPRGYRLNRQALDDLLQAKRISITEAAVASGLVPNTLAKLAQGRHRASITTVRLLAEGIGCSAETLFPELGKFRAPETPEEAVAS